MADNGAPVNSPLKGVTVSTTDATPTQAFTFATENDCTYFVDAKILATETTDYDESATYWRQLCFQNDGGTLAIVGAEREVVSDNETTGGWDAALTASGTNIICTVTGGAATNVNWRVVVDILKVK